MQSIVDFVVNHAAVFAGLGVAVLDLIFAINPKADANGGLHWVYLKLKALASPKPQ